MNKFYLGQTFIDRYPDEAITWSNVEGYSMINTGKNDLGQIIWQIQQPSAPNPNDIPKEVKIAVLEKELGELTSYVRDKYSAGINIPSDKLNRIKEIYNELKTLDSNRANPDFTQALMSYNLSDLLKQIYPVGSIYIGIMATCPMQTLGVGTWNKVSEGRVLQGSDGSHGAGSTINAGLPNITGGFDGNVDDANNGKSGPFYDTGIRVSGSNGNGEAIGGIIGFDASRVNGIYGSSTTVQPPAYVVNIWQRVS